MKELNSQQMLELGQRVDRYLNRAITNGPLLKKLQWKATGGHPDQYNPDPLWREAFDAVLLLSHDLGEAAVLLRDVIGYKPVDQSGSVELPSAPVGTWSTHDA